MKRMTTTFQEQEDLMELTPDWFWETNAKSAFTYSSKNIESILGYTLKEILKTSPFDFLKEEQKLASSVAFSAILQKHFPFSGFRKTYLTKNGVKKDFELYGVPYHDSQGNFSGYRGISRIVKNSQKALKNFNENSIIKALIDASLETVILINTDGKILDINEVGAARLGSSKQNLLNNSLYDYLPHEVASFRKNIVDEVIKNGKGKLFTDDREGVHFRSNVIPILDDNQKVNCVVIYAEDITSQLTYQKMSFLINSIDQLVLDNVHIDDIFDSICKQLVDIFDFSCVFIGRKELNGSISIRAKSGIAHCYVEDLEKSGLRWNGNISLCDPIGNTLDSEKYNIFDINDKTTNCIFKLAEPHSIQTIITLPLLHHHHETYGALVVCLNKIEKHLLSEISIHLHSIAKHISISLEKSENQLEMSLLSNALQVTSNSVMIADNLGYIVWTNDAFEKLTGYSTEELKGKTPRALKSGKQPPEYYTDLWETILSGNSWRKEIVDKHRNGQEIFVRQTITPIKDCQGNISNFISVMEDITEEKKIKDRLEKLAHFDTLTGLPNRALFIDRFQQALNWAERHNTLFTLLFMDIDHFKEVNDAQGHDIGDELLIKFAERLVSAIRKVDIAARLGGDEFTVILTETSDHREAMVAIEKILVEIEKPLELNGKPYQIQCSIGAAMYPIDGTDCESLLKKADKSMYEAKKGRAAIRFFYEQAET